MADDIDNTLYYVDGAALRQHRERRGYSVETLARLAHVHPALIERLEDPDGWPRKGMSPERRSQAKGMTVRLIAWRLRIPPETLAPDMPAKPPEKRPPDHRLIDTPPRLPGNWRHKSQKRDVKQRRWQMAVDEWETSHGPDADIGD